VVKPYKSGAKNIDSTISYKNIIYEPGIKGPIIVANNKIVYEPENNKSDTINLFAGKITYYQPSNQPSISNAIEKWGNKAKNGVFELQGKYSIIHSLK
jgi:hypothetical protein